jgi:peptide/nickel transport system ATP-binding protein
MRQRVAIAIALLHRPDLIVADEPTTALDVTIQGQILAEVQKLAATTGTSLIWITHDLSVVAGLADDIAVMYAGRIVEQGDVGEVLDTPLHPYTHGPDRQRAVAQPARGAAAADPGHDAVAAVASSPLRLPRPLPCARRKTARRCRTCTPGAPAARALATTPASSTGGCGDRAVDFRPGPPRASLFTEGPRPDGWSLRGRVAPLLQEARHRGECCALRSAPRRCGRKSSTPVGPAVDLRVRKGRWSAGRLNRLREVRRSAAIGGGILPQSEGRGALERHSTSANLQCEAERAPSCARQMIFQDPYASLNPRMRVATSWARRRRCHGLTYRGGFDDYVDEQMRRAGLDPNFKRRYPHQFSGGQRQRIGIARALAVQPEFLVCDEAVAALDVSIQAQILNLFMRLRRELDLTYLFISHDLSVVEHLSDRVVIMYLGRVVEEALAEDVFTRPNHPYTQSLLASVPRIENRKRAFATVKGEIPSPLNPPTGCHFHPRCPFAFDRCKAEVPALREVAPGQRSACHLNDAA